MRCHALQRNLMLHATPNKSSGLVIHLLACAEDVVDEPVDGQTRGHIEGEPTCRQALVSRQKLDN